MPHELILLVEDNARNLELVRDVLEYHGFRTLEAIDAAAGLACARAHRPDLILMDIQLHNSDGVQALRWLRADRVTADIPVVALTAFAMAEDRKRFLEQGFDGYLPKPIDIKALPIQVAQYCRARAHSAET